MARASPASCLYRHNRHSLSHKQTLAHKTCSPQASVALGLATVYSQSNTSKLFCYKFDQTDSEFRNITFHFQTVQAPPPFPLCCGPTWGTLLKRHQFISRLSFQTSTFPFASCSATCWDPSGEGPHFGLCPFATSRAITLRASRVKRSRALWVNLKRFTVPEQVDAQGQLLERRAQTRVFVPALLHDFMYLKKSRTRTNKQTNKKKTTGSDLIPDMETES